MTQKKYLKESIKLGNKDLIVETGKVAKQADGSVVISYGDTMLLVTAVSGRTAKEGLDFFPLTVEYREAAFLPDEFPETISAAKAARVKGSIYLPPDRPSRPAAVC